MEAWSDSEIDAYVTRWGEDPTNQWLVEAAELEGGEALLDIGCGSGAALRHAASMGHRGPLFGVDPFARMIAHAERLRGAVRIDLRVASAEALPFATGSFDSVLAINSVHHWRDIPVGLAETARVLRPDGTLTLGGEVFGADVLPEGQDYAPQLVAAGLVPGPRRELDDGRAFVVRARKGGDV